MSFELNGRAVWLISKYFGQPLPFGAFFSGFLGRQPSNPLVYFIGALSLRHGPYPDLILAPLVNRLHHRLRIEPMRFDIVLACQLMHFPIDVQFRGLVRHQPRPGGHVVRTDANILAVNPSLSALPLLPLEGLSAIWTNSNHLSTPLASNSLKDIPVNELYILLV